MPASSIRAMPWPSMPTLFEMVCRFETLLRTSAAIRFSGTPHSPKPPIMMLEPSAMSAIAASAVATILFTGPSIAVECALTLLQRKREHGTARGESHVLLPVYLVGHRAHCNFPTGGHLP